MRAWDQFVEELAKELGSDASERWLRSLQVKHFDAANVYIEARDSFQAMWFEEHLRSKVDARLKNENGRPIKVHLSVANEPGSGDKQTEKSAPKKKREAKKPFVLEPDSLDPHQILDNIIPWEGNLLGVRLLGELVSGETELGTFNPIYLTGGTGSGKTHLLHAFAQGLEQHGHRVLYVRGATFTQHMVGAIRANKMHSFREMYRNVDVLLVDDIDILSGKGTTQEEFFHTFNALHLAGKQIVLSAKCAPQELVEVEARLVSRFEWGIVVPLELPTEEQLGTVLSHKAKVLEFELSKSVREFLLDHFGRNSHTLIRALEALVLRVHINHKGGYLPSRAIEVTLAKHLLGDLVKEEQKAILTPEKIVDSVAQFYELTSDEIVSKSQSREVVLPRKVAMHLFRTRLNLPFKKIGRYFDRDHSTVMSSVRWVEAALNRRDQDLAPNYQRITRHLQAQQEEATSC